jgi:ATP-dependent DNA helicase RecG
MVIASLDSSVQYIKGVGPKKAAALARMGIFTARDLLNYYPREYDDRRVVVKASLLSPQPRVTVAGRIMAVDVIKLSRNLSVFKVAVSDGTGIIYGQFFRKSNPYHSHDIFSSLRAKFTINSSVIMNGASTVNFGEKQINVDEYEIYESEANAPQLLLFKRIIPIYPLTAGITNKWLREIIADGLEKYSNCFEEIVPENVKQQLGLMPVNEAVKRIHFPDEAAQAEASRHSIAFNEYILLETALIMTRNNNDKIVKERCYDIKRTLLTPFREKLGFELTHSQKKTINEIFSDMRLEKPMNRLLMGDVGSGKTVVALSAILLAIENGYQAAFLAPTEILAEQHYITIKRLFEGLNVRVALLSGRLSRKIKDKTEILKSIESGEVKLVVATHAAFEKNVKFHNLALNVIDEQHRFGVLQRAKMQEKSANPDTLLMTATPIPRTLSLTLYGDMDISVINELPPGRQPIKTTRMSGGEAYQFVKKEVALGRQAYIVYPLVEESDKVELKAAVQEAAALSSSEFKDFKVGLIHGQLPPEEKDVIMQDFRARKFDILIATTVIEVGIDVPNASVIVIEHADRFGLATLHQLRGRVGRGKDKSFCILVGNPKTDEAVRRLETMEKYSSGFKLAEEDLNLRGPGEFFGTAQHGILQLKAGNLIKDVELIEKAKQAAASLLAGDPELKSPELSHLRAEIIKQYANRLELLMIG